MSYGLRKQVLTKPYGVCVCREPEGRSVFESTDYDTAKRELARLNAGGSEQEYFRPRSSRMPEGESSDNRQAVSPNRQINTLNPPTHHPMKTDTQ